LSVLALPREEAGRRGRRSCCACSFRRKIVAVGRRSCCSHAAVGLIAPFFAVDPGRMDVAARLRAPSPMHWFGTDDLGRDVYARVVYGARLSLLVGVAVALFSFTVGLTAGLAAGTSAASTT
jgi:peptide/nickel transport system permease protein